MSNAGGAKPTLENIITRFRREVLRTDGAAVELEVRLREVDYANFSAIYRALLKDEATAPEVRQTVNSIMNIRRAKGDTLQPMRIREIVFEGGARQRENYVRKEPLMPPYHVSSALGISYHVALAAEHADQAFSSDEGATIRVKARVSFRLLMKSFLQEDAAQLPWRVDMTVTRQLAGSNASGALKAIVDQMFRTTPPMTAANFLDVLNLAAAPTQQLYRFEVEAEFAGDAAAADAVRPEDVTAVANALLHLANPDHMLDAAKQAEIFRAARYVVKAPEYLRRFQHELGMKRLLPQALAITRTIYRGIYPPRGYYVTDKADGKRALGLVHDGRGFIVSDTMATFAAAAPDAAVEESAEPAKKKGNAGVTAESALSKSSKKAAPVVSRLQADTIVDGELVESGEHPVLYAFDLIAVAGADVTGLPFEARLERMAEAVAILREAGVPAEAKPYGHIAGDTPAELEKAFRAVADAKRPYTTDGLILVEPGKPYDETTNSKWKPAEHNTIDFYVRRAPSNVLGKPPFVDKPGHKLHFLFVGINQELYEALGLHFCPGYGELFPNRAASDSRAHFPVQFSPSDAPYAYLYQHPDKQQEVEGKIAEMRYELATADWHLTRIREDRRQELASKRYFGNDFYTAEIIWLNYVDPFPMEQLWDGPALDYFRRDKSGAYRAQTAVISFVKTQRIMTLRRAGWVVDLASGKGQDLGRYLSAEVHHLVAVDNDRAALSELVRRKYCFAGRATAGFGEEGAECSRVKHHGRGGRQSTTIHVLVADLGAPHAETAAKIRDIGAGAEVDAVVCNLAVHYFLASTETMRNFVALCRDVVKPGGQVVLTVLDGAAVHALLRKIPSGASWDVTENETRKYSIRRQYASDTLQDAGQKIGVLLPFSDGEYYEEYLVNVEALAAEFTKRGFTRTEYRSVAKSLPDFEARNRALAGQLTPGDRAYLALYSELCFAKSP
jgi:SAM-dependent methyltransferase